jgi:hypothetical protein
MQATTHQLRTRTVHTQHASVSDKTQHAGIDSCLKHYYTACLHKASTQPQRLVELQWQDQAMAIMHESHSGLMCERMQQQALPATMSSYSAYNSITSHLQAAHRRALQAPSRLAKAQARVHALLELACATHPHAADIAMPLPSCRNGSPSHNQTAVFRRWWPTMLRGSCSHASKHPAGEWGIGLGRLSL